MCPLAKCELHGVNTPRSDRIAPYAVLQQLYTSNHCLWIAQHKVLAVVVRRLAQEQSIDLHSASTASVKSPDQRAAVPHEILTLRRPKPNYTLRCRWGDYSGIAMDPDGKTFWAYNGYGQPNNAWGTWLAAFQCETLLRATKNITVSGRKLLAATTITELGKGTENPRSTKASIVPTSAQVAPPGPIDVLPAKARAEAIYDEPWSELPDGGATRSPGGDGCAPGGTCPSAPGCGGS